jgi:hypothetical protein
MLDGILTIHYIAIVLEILLYVQWVDSGLFAPG